MKKLRILILVILSMFFIGCNQKVTNLNIEPFKSTSKEKLKEDKEMSSELLINEKYFELEASKENSKADKEFIEVTEKFFIQQCNDIYMNYSEYEGKTITIEGMYTEVRDTVTGNMHYYVFRKTPGCCGNDGIAGFEIAIEGNYPNLNEWIKVSGKLGVEKGNDGYNILKINLSEIKVLDKRGAEFVTN